ncbi:hypothetical protein [Propionibacterium freudenreichii]|uniref:hypothetical protein n=1 Tax=Propionibacterium freudenreichii TaxID=1744 RepID=UPI0012D354A8|nr:hypothetical protein [Propionibacterium freudenreichii]MDK9318919.1 hypothetical protein [Propionibacterium freudenreichii]MDK9343732.1 hypothetical protein [Propionibacterium freudenreichii]MDK9642042.1 hypothetical protein [Propionibacterium freudenreichii]MDK9657517.1 hypothetical protein [Propionibacterium freudenreichii]MDK9669329.1 hypothetical protein [Propionibacterium freudenreichii]
MTMKKLMLSVVALGLTILAATGCSASPAKQLQKGPEADASYNAEASRLVWPAGYPAPTPEFHKETLVNNEPGVGEGAADTLWLCSWENYYLDAPSAHAQETIERMRGFKSLYDYMHNYTEDAQKYFDGVLSALELGDSGPLAADVDANCIRPQ